MGNANLKWSGLLSKNLGEKNPKRCKEPNSVGMACNSFHLEEVLIVKQHIMSNHFFFWLHTLNGSIKAHVVDLFKLKSLRVTKTAF